MNLVIYELYWTILSRNINLVAAKQVALDNSLVPPEKTLKIKKCNARIEFSKPQREETYQVTLDAPKLSPCYPAFLITAEVAEIYRHQFWNIIQKIKDTNAYRFKLHKKKCRIDIEELGYSGKCDMISAIHTDQMHHPWRTFTAIINSESVPKKKTPAKVDRGKGMDLFSNVALLEVVRLKKALKKGKLKTHKLHESRSGDGVGSQPKVLDEQKDKTTCIDEGTDSGDDASNDDDNDEVTKDDDEDDVESDADDDNKANNKVVSMMNVKVLHEEPSTQTLLLLNIPVTIFNPCLDSIKEFLPWKKNFLNSNKLTILQQLLKMIKSQIPAMVDAQLSTKLEDSIKKSFRSYTTEFEKKAKDERKRYIDHVEKDQQDKDKDPPVGSDQGLKNQKTSKDVKPSRGSKSKESKSSLSEGSKSQPKSSGKSAQANEPMFETADTKMPLNQGEDLGNNDDQPNVKATSKDYWFKKPERPLTPDSDWNATKAIDFIPRQT
nr:hypothetical protein [Tanacetum cinerariifolium]